VPARVRWRTLTRRGLAVRVRLIAGATIRARVSGHRGTRSAWSSLGRATRRVPRAETVRVRLRVSHRPRRRPTRARVTVSIARGNDARIDLRATLRIVP
jgi:hypothetical protein